MTAVIADSPTKFEIWFRKRKPGDTYTLQCASEDIKKAWTEELSKLLWKQALRNRGKILITKFRRKIRKKTKRKLIRIEKILQWITKIIKNLQKCAWRKCQVWE